MNIGSTRTISLSKKEFIKLIGDTFEDDPLSNICVITQIAEYDGEVRQSILFSENFNLN